MNNKIQCLKWLYEGKRVRCTEWKSNWYVRLVGENLVDDCDRIIDIRLSNFLDYEWELYKDEETEYYYDMKKGTIKEVDVEKDEYYNDDFYEYSDSKYDDNFYYDDYEKDEFDCYYDDDDYEYNYDSDDESDDDDW